MKQIQRWLLLISFCFGLLVALCTNQSVHAMQISALLNHDDDAPAKKDEECQPLPDGYWHSISNMYCFKNIQSASRQTFLNNFFVCNKECVNTIHMQIPGFLFQVLREGDIACARFLVEKGVQLFPRDGYVSSDEDLSVEDYMVCTLPAVLRLIFSKKSTLEIGDYLEIIVADKEVKRCIADKNLPYNPLLWCYEISLFDHLLKLFGEHSINQASAKKPLINKSQFKQRASLTLPLHYHLRSAKSNNQIIEYLLEKGADVNRLDGRNKVPLIAVLETQDAVSPTTLHKYFDRMKLLVDMGAIVDRAPAGLNCLYELLKKAEVKGKLAEEHIATQMVKFLADSNLHIAPRIFYNSLFFLPAELQDRIKPPLSSSSSVKRQCEDEADENDQQPTKFERLTCQKDDSASDDDRQPTAIEKLTDKQ